MNIYIHYKIINLHKIIRFSKCYRVKVIDFEVRI